MAARWHRLAILLGLACGAAAPPDPATLPRRTQLRYGPAPEQIVDLMVPPRPAGAPPPHLAIFVHGGGWTAGGPEIGAWVAGALAPLGFAVASVDYRKVPAVPVEQQIADVAAAIAHTARDARAHGIATDGLLLAGHSSGGHVVALLGTDPAWLRAAGIDAARIAAILPLDGLFDLTQGLPDGVRLMRNSVFGPDRGRQRRLSPTAHAATAAPATTFCIAAETQEPGFATQAKAFAAALAAQGRRVRLLTAPGLSHTDMALALGDSGHAVRGFAQTCLKAAFAG